MCHCNKVVFITNTIISIGFSWIKSLRKTNIGERLTQEYLSRSILSCLGHNQSFRYLIDLVFYATIPQCCFKG